MLVNIIRLKSKFNKLLSLIFRRYDGHLLVKALAERLGKKDKELKGLTVIPRSMEQYTGIVTSKFRFIG